MLFRSPENTAGIEISPLIFVSFVENAFKHGVSYESESFIRVKMTVEDGRLIFKCANSRHESNTDSSSGIGTRNVRKKLELLYGNDFTFNIDSDDKVYEILVIIPVQNDKMSCN